MAASMAERVRQSAERHIHSFLESLPFMAMSALRRERLPSGYLADALATVSSLIAVSYAEELWRCARARKR